MYNLSGIAYGEVYAIQIYVILDATGQSCSPGTCTCILVSFTQKTCLHDTTEILLILMLNRHDPTQIFYSRFGCHLR
jgi:hypothetical protein